MAESSVKFLLLYGDRAVGKSTLELNLRRCVGARWATLDMLELSESKRIAFLGPTALRRKDGLHLRANGGAENLEDIPVLHKDVRWVVASLPTSASDGKAFAIRNKLISRFETHVISLYSPNNQRFIEQRMNHFSKRPTLTVGKPANPKKPPTLSWDVCTKFETEALPLALEFCLTMLQHRMPSDYVFHSLEALDSLLIHRVTRTRVVA